MQGQPLQDWDKWVMKGGFDEFSEKETSNLLAAGSIPAEGAHRDDLTATSAVRFVPPLPPTRRVAWLHGQSTFRAWCESRASKKACPCGTAS